MPEKPCRGRQIFGETGARAGVADRPGRNGFHKNCVAVAVKRGADKRKMIAGALTLRPKPLFRAAEKRHQPLLNGGIGGIPVHIAKHQHLACRSILDNCRQQAFALAPVGVAPVLGRFGSGSHVTSSLRFRAGEDSVSDRGSGSARCGTPTPQDRHRYRSSGTGRRNADNHRHHLRR